MLIPNYTKLEKFFLENRKKIEHYRLGNWKTQF